MFRIDLQSLGQSYFLNALGNVFLVYFFDSKEGGRRGGGGGLLVQTSLFDVRKCIFDIKTCF